MGWLHCSCLATRCKTNIWQKQTMKGTNHTFFFDQTISCALASKQYSRQLWKQGMLKACLKIQFLQANDWKQLMFRIFHGVHCNQTFLSKWDLGWKGLAEHVFLEGENGRPNVNQKWIQLSKNDIFWWMTFQTWKIWVAARLDRKDNVGSNWYRIQQKVNTDFVVWPFPDLAGSRT